MLKTPVVRLFTAIAKRRTMSACLAVWLMFGAVGNLCLPCKKNPTVILFLKKGKVHDTCFQI